MEMSLLDLGIVLCIFLFFFLFFFVFCTLLIFIDLFFKFLGGFTLVVEASC